MSGGHSITSILTLAGVCVLAACSKQMPELTIDSLPKDSLVKGVGSFTGTAAEKSGIRSVTLYVDANRAAQGSLRESAKRNVVHWQATVDTSPMPMGLHYLTVLVRANNGGFTQQTLTIVVSR